MPIQRIFFERLITDAHIGILDHELRATQPLLIDAEFDVLVSQPAIDDDIHSVLDYRLLRQAILDECTRGHTHLLETLCERLLERLLTDFPELLQVRLRVSKPSAFSDCAAVGIEVCRERAKDEHHD